MNRWCQAASFATLCAAVTPHGAGAQSASPSKRPTVLFVCEHGTVRSLLAKILFEDYARLVGLRMRAVSRGTHADSVVPPWMSHGLAADHIALGSWRPRTLDASDLATASYIVSFDVQQSATAGARAPRTQWDARSTPSASFVAE